MATVSTDSTDPVDVESGVTAAIDVPALTAAADIGSGITAAADVALATDFAIIPIADDYDRDASRNESVGAIDATDGDPPLGGDERAGV